MSDRGWMHTARHDVEMRAELERINIAHPGHSALDVLDGLIDIVDRLGVYERLLCTIIARSDEYDYATSHNAILVDSKWIGAPPFSHPIPDDEYRLFIRLVEER